MTDSQQVPTTSSNSPDYTEFAWGEVSPEHRLAIGLDPKTTRLVRLVEVVELLEKEKVRKLGTEKIQAASRALLGKLAGWAELNRDRVRRVFLTTQDGHLLALVVGPLQYDEELHDRLLAFDVSLVDDSELEPLRVQTQLVPDTGTDPTAFVCERFAIEYRFSNREHAVS